MLLPTAVAICENDLRRDLTFLKAFGEHSVDLRVTPVHGGTLDSKSARMLHRQIQGMAAAGLGVKAIVVHHDVDRSTLAKRRKDIEDWFASSDFGPTRPALVICAPLPCLERWLCVAHGIDSKVRSTKPSAGCDPWKTAWGRGKGIDLDRVRLAANSARKTLAGLPDFDAFFQAWRSAGLS